MPLERFFKDEQVNIKDLTIENPEKEEELWFDPEKEMTEEAWKEIKELFEGIYFTDLGSVARSAAMLMQAYPEKAKESGAETVAKELQKDGEKILEEYEHGERDTPRWGPSDLLYGMKILEPELFRKVATPERMERCTESVLDDLPEFIALKHAIFTACKARTFMPQEKVNDASKELWKKAWDKTNSAKAAGHWVSFMEYAARARLLFPEKFAELGIDDEVRKNMKKEFQETREKSRHYPQSREYFLNEAVALKILAAEEIKFKEDGGFELIMRKEKPDLESKTPPMPEKRNF